MPLFDLLAELRERGSVRLRFRLCGCNAGFPIGDPSSSAIAVIDRDHPLDAVQLNGGGEIVPKRLVPVLERRRDHADRRTCDDELAELPGQILLDRVLRAPACEDRYRPKPWPHSFLRPRARNKERRGG